MKILRDNTGHPPGLVTYIAANRPRFASFYDSLNATHAPEGSDDDNQRGYNAARNRNELCNFFMDERKDLKWIWLLDDDAKWHPQTLMWLLEANVDIVGPIYAERFAPFAPIAKRVFRPSLEVENYSWNELKELYKKCGNKKIIEVAATGASGLLIRRNVLEKMERPYFRLGIANSGCYPKDSMSEDTGFCARAILYGFKIHCMLGIEFWHGLDETFITPYLRPDGTYSVCAEIDGQKIDILTEDQRNAK